MVTPLRIDLVDLSHHNPVTIVALDRARDAGVRGVYHKCTEGSTFKDSAYLERKVWCETLKIPFGAYHFARPERGDAKAEAEAFIAAAGSAFRPGVNLRPVLDLEDEDTALTPRELTEWVKVWTGVVHHTTGAAPMIYTPFDLTDNFGYPLWVARYSPQNAEPTIPKPWGDWLLRQFSNGQLGVPNKVPGLGAVDLNTLHAPADFAKLLIPVPAPPPAPKPPAETLVAVGRRQVGEGLATLDRAVANGRTGWVRIATAAIRAGYRQLPKR